MTTNVNRNTYVDGRRVCEQTVTYTKADDLRRLGQLQMEKANILERIETEEARGNITEHLQLELNRVNTDLAEAQGYVNGYEGA